MEPALTNKVIVPKIEKLPKRFIYHAVKRFFDLFAAIVLLIILCIPLAIFALLIKRDHGPAIFKQERLGRGGKPFVIYKLRTMHVDAENDGRAGPKKTTAGHQTRQYLRRWQSTNGRRLFNILKGQMSVSSGHVPRSKPSTTRLAATSRDSTSGCWYPWFDRMGPSQRRRRFKTGRKNHVRRRLHSKTIALVRY
jgi:lipopolysaccharide/colanic/teichoic acid biosynthesis glycosyltransferase